MGDPVPCHVAGKYRNVGKCRETNDQRVQAQTLGLSRGRHDRVMAQQILRSRGPTYPAGRPPGSRGRAANGALTGSPRNPHDG